MTSNLAKGFLGQVHEDRISLRNRSDRFRMAIDWHWFDRGDVLRNISAKRSSPSFQSMFSWWGKELDLVTWFWHKLSSSVWGLEGDISNFWNAAAEQSLEVRIVVACANVTLCACLGRLSFSFKSYDTNPTFILTRHTSAASRQCFSSQYLNLCEQSAICE